MNSTVKRKFNALLQGIGNRPATDSQERSLEYNSHLADTASSPASRRSSPYVSGMMAADSSSSLELLNKKRRVGAPTSTPTKYGTALESSPASIRSVRTPVTTTISNITLRKWAPGTASPALKRDGMPPPPRYCPGDRDQLLRRLATFQELTDWTPKPDRVNEVEWAKRGWVCQGKERVRCTLCARELVVKVNRKEVDGKEISVLIASEIAESVVDKYAELIVESHEEDCLWRKKGCDDSLLRLPLPNPKLALSGLRQRYDELCERAAFLPYEFNLRLPPTLDLDTVITYLPPNFFTEPPPPQSSSTTTPTTTTTTTTTTSPAQPQPQPQPPINRPALALALLGWQSLTNPLLNNAPVPNSASCHTCLRRLGLWMFKPREVDPDTGAVLVPAPMDHLDPVREHRFFCPWKNGAAQRNPGSRSGAAAAGGSSNSSGNGSSGAAMGARGLAGGKGDRGGDGEKEEGGEGEGEGEGKEKDRHLPAAWEVLVTGLRNEAFIRGKMGRDRDRDRDRDRGERDRGRGRSKTETSGGSNGGGKEPGESSGGDGAPPKTPERPRPVTAGGTPRIRVGDGEWDGEGAGVDGENEEEARKRKELDMKSRLRRVKSLFNTKAGTRLKKLGGNRPGTSHSSVGGGE